MEAETEKTETSPANGASSVPSVKAPKPWIDAGFTSRDAWRASKGQKTGKTKKPAVKADAPKAPSKSSSKLAAVGKPKVKKAKKAKLKAAAAPTKKSKKLLKKSVKMAAKGKSKAEKKGPGVKDNSLDPVPVAELSARLKKVFLAVPKGGTKTLAEIEKKAFGSMPHKKASSVVRNQMRYLRVHKMMKKLGDGRYKRVA